MSIVPAARTDSYRSRPKNQHVAEKYVHCLPPMEEGLATLHGCSMDASSVRGTLLFTSAAVKTRISGKSAAAAISLVALKAWLTVNCMLLWPEHIHTSCMCVRVCAGAHGTGGHATDVSIAPQQARAHGTGLPSHPEQDIRELYGRVRRQRSVCGTVLHGLDRVGPAVAGWWQLHQPHATRVHRRTHRRVPHGDIHLGTHLPEPPHNSPGRLCATTATNADRRTHHRR